MITFKQFLESDDMDDMISAHDQADASGAKIFKTFTSSSHIRKTLHALAQSHGLTSTDYSIEVMAYEVRNGVPNGFQIKVMTEPDAQGPIAKKCTAMYHELERLIAGRGTFRMYEFGKGGCLITFKNPGKKKLKEADDMDDLMSAHDNQSRKHKAQTTQWWDVNKLKQDLWDLAEPDLEARVTVMGRHDPESRVFISVKSDHADSDPMRARRRIKRYFDEVEAVASSLPDVRFDKQEFNRNLMSFTFTTPEEPED